MKKVAVFVLLFVLFVTALTIGCSGVSDSEICVAEIVCKDNYPLSYKEIKDAVKYNNVFILDLSFYEMEVVLSDSSRHLIKESEVIDEAETTVTVTENTADNRCFVDGWAYVDFDECEQALAEGKTTVPVHVWVSISVYNKDKGGFIGTHKEKVTFEKEIVPQFVQIELISGKPEYVYKDSRRVDLKESVFEIKYWNGEVKTLKPVSRDDYFGYKYYYTLDGYNLNYGIDFENQEIDLYFLDAEWSVAITGIRESLFSSAEIKDCVFEGNVLKEISYSITYKDGQTVDYVKEVTDGCEYASCCIDGIDGYEVLVGSDSSVATARVRLLVGTELREEEIFDIEPEGFYKTFFGRIIFMFYRITEKIKFIIK